MIDPNTLLQMLMQQDSSPPTQPVSGIGGGTPLSGLMLGEQGMGLGGGGGMLIGAPSGGGPQMGGGGDLSQLLAMMQAASGGGDTGVGGGAVPTLGQGGGGALGAGFGSGGPLLPQQGMGFPQDTIGQTAGVGGGNIFQTLDMIKKLGQIVTPKVPTGSVPGIGETTLPPVGGSFVNPVGTTLEQIQGTQPGFFSLTGEGTGGPLDPRRFSLGVSPNLDIGSLAAGTVRALPGAPPAGQIMEGVGDGISGGLPGGLQLPGLGGILKGAGVAGGLATAGTAFSQGNVGAGLTDLLGLGLSLTVPEIGIPFSILGSILGLGGDFWGRPSTFKATRKAAAQAGEFDIGHRQNLINQALQMMDPSLALQALQWISADNPWPGIDSPVGRNPVRTDIGMSPDIGRALGFNPAQDIQQYLRPRQFGGRTAPSNYMIRGGPGWTEAGDLKQFPGFAQWGPTLQTAMARLGVGQGPSAAPPYGLYLQGQGHLADMPSSPFRVGQPWQTGQSGLGQFGGQQQWVPGPWERQPGTVNPEGTTYTPDVFNPGWGAFTPQQFSQFLNMYKQNPTQFNITGSGDVAYLQQGPAEALAARSRQQTLDLLSQLTQWPQFA